MKKFVTAILAVLYLGTSTGATVHMHYCMGKLADWGLGHNKSKTCGNCGMEKSEEKDNGCCKDEHKFVNSLLIFHYRLLTYRLNVLPVQKSWFLLLPKNIL